MILNGDGDLAMDGSIRPYIGKPVELVKITKGGLYQIRTADGKLFSVPKRNLDEPPSSLVDDSPGAILPVPLPQADGHS